MPIKIDWIDNNSDEDGHRIYISPAPMDPANLPEPHGEVGPDVTTYTAADADPDVPAYIIVSAFKGTAEAASTELVYDPAAEDPTAAIVGVALVDDTVQGGQLVHINAAGGEIATPPAAWFNLRAPFGGIADALIDGQYMVRVPKFYYRRDVVATGALAGKEAWWVSPAPQPGYSVHPAFVLDGQEVDQFWIGKYEGSLEGGKLCSVPGVVPAGNGTWQSWLDAAAARNVGGVDGFRAAHLNMRTAIQLLYLIENASFDSQWATAPGNISGSPVYVDSPVNLDAGYRGIAGLWGNHSENIDGIRTNAGQIELRGYTGGWLPMGIGLPGSGNNHQPRKLRKGPGIDHLFLADTFDSVDDGQRATIPDSNRFGSGTNLYGHAGGTVSNGLRAGLWYLFANNAESYTNANIGSRLARVL